MGYVFMAIWKAADGKIGASDLREITAEFMHLLIIQMSTGGKDANKAKDLKKMKDILRPKGDSENDSLIKLLTE